MPMRRSLSPLLLLTLALFGASLGCSGGTSKDGVLQPDGFMPETAPRELAFVFRTRGDDGAIPNAVAFHSNLPVFPSSSVGKAPPAGTELVLDPPVPGTLTVEDRSSLVFTATESLKPGTVYHARLVSIGTGLRVDGSKEPPEWLAGWTEKTAEFTTPPFAFSRAALVTWQKDQAAILLSFSGPVSVDDVATHVRLVDGDSAVAASFEAGGTPNTVQAIVRGDALKASVGRDVTVDVSAGVKLADDASVEAGQSSTTVKFAKPGPAMTVAAVKVREGMNGFYVDVLCKDDAVEGRRWFWDRETYDDYELSTRCMLDDASTASGVHVSVEGRDVPVTVTASDTGFRVFGEFPFGQLTLRVDAGATTVDGGTLPTALDNTLDIPHRAAKLDFANRGRYLPHSAWTALAIQHTNVPAVELTVRHIPQENLVFWMSGNEPADSRTANVVLKKQIALPDPIDEKATSWIDVGGLLPDAESGVYELSLAQVDPAPEAAEPVEEDESPDTGGGWRPSYRAPADARAVSRILLTDMHLVAKVSATDTEHSWARSVDAWAVDVHTNAPLSGVKVSLVRPSGQGLGACSTDGDGHCSIALPADSVDATAPIALLATKGKDFTYLKFADLRLQVPADTAGATGAAAPYRVALWTDRGVYRPGDVAHVAALVRGEDHLAPSPAVPAVLKLYDPTGKELRKQVVEANEAGIASWDVTFGDWATTGAYRVASEIGGKSTGDVTFNVEEFVPERLRVAAAAKIQDALATDSVAVDVQGDWLFGGAAVGSEVELSCQVEPGAFAPVAQPGYHFGPIVVDGETTPRPVTLGTASGTLDELGHAAITCPTAPGAGGLTGPGTLTARAAVFEGESGRTTVSSATVHVHPGPAYAGLKAPETADVGHPFKLDGVVTDWQGKPVTGSTPVKLTLMRLEEEVGWVWDEDSNESVYRRTPRRAQEAIVQVNATNGAFSTELTPNQDAQGWIVVAEVGRSRTEVRVDSAGRRWWWSSWDSSIDQTPRPQLPGSLPLKVPDSARVGEDIVVTTRAPYAGRLLWTVETDSVTESHWQDVQAGDTSWTFDVDGFKPNVYVSALLIKDPHAESAEAFLPDRAFGVASVRIVPEKYTIDVAITVPTEVRPQSPLTIQLDIGKQTEPAFVTVAAVDEGILSLTHFADPDPEPTIFARRALGVNSYETVGWTLLSQPGGAGRRTGGDSESGGGRVQMVHPVALWSGVVVVPESGKTSVTLPIPSYRGSLHVMAVAATRTKMGSASADVVVRDPLTLVATMPRFLTVGDLAQVPVQVTNLTGSAQDVRLEMNVSEAASPGQLAFVDVAGRGLSLGLGGAQSGRLKLAPNASGTLVFQLAARTAGAARVDVKATAGKEVSTDHFDIPVGLWEPEDSQTVRLPLDGPTSLSSALAGWKPGTERTQVWVTANPYAQAFGHLKHLLHYPYGCIEQTTSSARPLLYARDLITHVAPDSVRDRKIEDMVQAGIDRVLGMQTPSGGFSYWPGGREPVVWGSTYAVHFLLDAQQAGYAVPKSDLDDAVRWLGREVSSTRVTDHDRAYVHYLLARAGQPQAATAQRLYDTLGKDASAEDIYMLQAAIWLAGDHRYETQLKHPRITTGNERRNDWSFWSSLRERGVTLSIFRDLFGADAAGQPLADAVASGLSESSASRWYNTQEIAWGLTGLAKSLSKDVESVTATLTRGGVAVPAASAGSWLLNAPTLQPGGLSIDGKKGLYAVVSTRGNRVFDKDLWGSHGVDVTREWKNAAGEAVDPTRLPLGTPIYVDITVHNTSRSRVQNLALTDRVAASWEIENPRLGRGALPDWVDPDSLWESENLDVRDDRISIFGALDADQEVHVVYMTRATFAGSFHVPEVSVEAMYDPTIWARDSGGSVVVTGPWEGKVL